MLKLETSPGPLGTNIVSVRRSGETDIECRKGGVSVVGPVGGGSAFQGGFDVSQLGRVKSSE